MMRPTLSPGLYIQMAGRGLRLKSHTDHCLVLDFAGVVETHGPITNVRIPGRKQEDSDALPPSKICPACDEILASQAKVCRYCGYEFPAAEHQDWQLHNDDIMGKEESSLVVTSWLWSPHISRKSGKEMVKITYFGALSDMPVTEYLCIFHDGYAGRKAIGSLKFIAASCQVEIDESWNTDELCMVFSLKRPPEAISYRKDGKFYRVTERVWERREEEEVESAESSFLARRII